MKEENEEIVAPVIYDISSYGADYDVEGLVKRLKRGDIFIPDFQREFVWNQSEASRLIESLLLGLPVPGIFLAKEQDTNRLLVIDGQQRLLSLKYFYEGYFAPKEKENKKIVFRLKNVQKKFEDATYNTLQEEDRIKLNDSILHATIIKQETPEDDNTSIYHVFERLNTGGRKLTQQEIRTAVYMGSLNDLIYELNEYPSWRSLYGPKHKRLRDQEMILRFLSLYVKKEKYKRPLSEYMNKFNGSFRNPKLEQLNHFRDIFKKTTDIIFNYFGNKAFRPDQVFNASTCEVFMVNIAKGINLNIDYKKMSEDIVTLYKNEDFYDSITRATSDEKVTLKRHELFNKFMMRYVYK